jgi:hypothetical protein
MKRFEPNYEKVFRDFPDHIFSKTETEGWKSTECNRVITRSADTISDLISKMKQICPDKLVVKTKPIKKFIAKLKLTKKSPINIKSLGVNLPIEDPPLIKFEDVQRLTDRLQPQQSNSHTRNKINMVLFNQLQDSLKNTNSTRRSSFLNFLNILNGTNNSNGTGTIEVSTSRDDSKAKVPNLHLTNVNYYKNNKCRDSADNILRMSKTARQSHESTMVEGMTPLTGSPSRSYRDIKKSFRDQLQYVHDSTFEIDPALLTNSSLRPVRAKIKRKTVGQDGKALQDFEKGVKRTLMTNTVLRTERKRLGNHIKNPDYTIEEIEDIKSHVKNMGTFITDRHGKRRYQSLNKDCLYTKDYFINAISDNTASTFRNIIGDKYLINEEKDYSEEIVKKLVSPFCINRVDRRQNKIIKLAGDVKGKLSIMLRKSQGLGFFNVT